MSDQIKIKGQKFYALTNGQGKYINYTDADKDYPSKHICKDSPYVVELTVTRVFTRNLDLQEKEL